MIKNSGRDYSLDGLRGLAAVSVVAFHFLLVFYPALAPVRSMDAGHGIDTPFGLLWNGHFAVAIFFVLSGYVLAGSVKDASFLYLLPKRWLRLAIPAAASSIFAWTLLSIFPTAINDLRALDNNPWLQWTYAEAPPLTHAIYDGLIGIFIRGDSLLNNVLWTMKIELLGSVLIYAIYCFCKQYRLTVLLIACVVVIAFRPGLIGFLLGALLFEAKGRLSIEQLRQAGKFAVAAFVFGLILGAPFPGFGSRVFGSSLLDTVGLGEPGGLVSTFAAAGVVFGVSNSAALKGIFSAKIPVFLGSISFAVYLCHVPIILIISSRAYLLAPHSATGFALAAVIVIIGTLVVAYLGTRFIDKPLLKALSKGRLSQGKTITAVSNYSRG